MPMRYQAVANDLQQSQRLVILTGAGASAESGVPTFRDALTGLWAQYDPTQLATPRAFRANPKLVWDWYQFRRDLVRQAQPNAGHYAIAQLQMRHPHVTLITQNVDDLHEQAGSPQVWHLHGRIFETKCFYNCQGNPTLVDEATLPPSDEVPPLCPHCGRWLRPNVVWFEESLPSDILQQSIEASEACDLMLIIGTSGMVQPAAQLPSLAQRKGARLIEINPHESALSASVNRWIAEPAGVALPAIMQLWEG